MSGQAVGRVKPYVSTKSKIGIEKMLDDDPESFYYCKEVQKKGDFFGVDLGVPREIRTVSIVMGRNDSDTDAVNRGQLEVSGRAVLVSPDAGVQRASRGVPGKWQKRPVCALPRYGAGGSGRQAGRVDGHPGFQGECSCSAFRTDGCSRVQECRG